MKVRVLKQEQESDQSEYDREANSRVEHQCENSLLQAQQNRQRNENRNENNNL